MSNEGWFVDPLRRHQERWISAGTPTALVRDDGVEGHDEPPAGSVRMIAGAEEPPKPAYVMPEQQQLPPPIIRPGIDPIGLRYVPDIVRNGLAYWRVAISMPAVSIILLLWLGRGVAASPVFWVLLALGLVPLLDLPRGLRRRRLAQRVLKQAAAKGEDVPAGPQFVTPSELAKLLIVILEYAAIALLLSR